MTRADAARLGFTGDRLHFTQFLVTANGRTRGAPARLREIRIGPIDFEEVPASVNEGELTVSLLGMRLLERLGAVEITNDALILQR